MPICHRALVWRFCRLDLVRHILGNRIMDGEGLRRGRMPILEFLRRNGGCTQKEIADGLRVSPASVAVSVNRMEKEGLVYRTADESDLRRNRVFITPAGLEQQEKCNQAFAQMDSRMFSGFSEAELETLNDMLNRLYDNLSGGEFDDLTPFNTYVLEKELKEEADD